VGGQLKPLIGPPRRFLGTLLKEMKVDLELCLDTSLFSLGGDPGEDQLVRQTRISVFHDGTYLPDEAGMGLVGSGSNVWSMVDVSALLR
jgi:hypothetical protein